ncbi:unnamed protein product, partial [Brassica oleracea var. botrytis]
KGCRFSRFPAVISTKHEPVLGFVAERSREAQRESFSAPLRMLRVIKKCICDESEGKES